MRKIAVFVDAGYLFSQGSVAIAGRQSHRSDLQITPGPAITLLRDLAEELSDGAMLLRIYWYDEAQRDGRRTPEHITIARMDDVKLRLGIINSRGQQKGVDSLILTDLIELARLKSIDEALLVSGDGDLRVGIQIAQNHGVRIHLLGLQPARGSQSPELMDEADTTREWDKAIVSKFLTLKQSNAEMPEPLSREQSAELPITESSSPFADAVASFVGTLERDTVKRLQAAWESGDQTIPPDIDRALLRKCFDQVGRSLNDCEKPEVRRLFRRAVKTQK